MRRLNNRTTTIKENFMRRFVSVLAVVVLCLVPVAAFAHAGHDHHKVMGTVVAIDATHIDVKTSKGAKVAVPLTSSTMFMRGNDMAKASDVKPGTRVVIELTEKGQAEHVKLPAAPKTK